MFGGMVIHGDGKGRTLGYPTANLDCRLREVKLSAGVYAAWAHLGKKKYQSALVITENPWKVEVYLLRYRDQDLYGRYIDVEPLAKVGPMIAYKRRTPLIKKIHADVKAVESIFEKYEKRHAEAA